MSLNRTQVFILSVVWGTGIAVFLTLCAMLINVLITGGL